MSFTAGLTMAMNYRQVQSIYFVTNLLAQTTSFYSHWKTPFFDFALNQEILTVEFGILLEAF